nr:unnamed protein product [Spirometra erinaceieuropaei]
MWWNAKVRIRPNHPPAASLVSGLLDSVLTPGLGEGGGESAVPPKIVKAPASTIKLVEGDTLQLSCVAEGNPRPTVTWLIQPFNRNLLPFLGRAMFPAKRVLEQLESTFIEMNGYLQVSHLDRKLSGLLACQAVNGVEPRAVREMLLDVRFPPEIDMLNPLIKQSLTRDTVLQCTANANPLGNIVWSYGIDRRRINASTCSILTDKKEKYCISKPTSEACLKTKLHYNTGRVTMPVGRIFPR